MKPLLHGYAAFLVLLGLATGCDDMPPPADGAPAPKDLIAEVVDAAWDDRPSELPGERPLDARAEVTIDDGNTPDQEPLDTPEVADESLDAEETEDAPAEVATDTRDADAPDGMDAGADVRDVADLRDAAAADVRDAADADVRDVADRTDAGDAWDPMYRVDRPSDDCVLPAPDVAVDAEPPCTAGRTRTCTCADGARGAAVCTIDGRWEFCRCESGDAGAPGGLDAGIPTITQPRLLAPISGLRVTSQRPTLRWAPPAGAARSRVELCDDRACTRPLVTREFAATSWRPDAALRAGPVFWRVRALDASGAVTWTSATWLFGVRHRDTPVDSSYGVMRDHNGDGYDDLVAYVNGDDQDPESVVEALQVYFGSASGLSLARRRILRPLDARSFHFADRFAVGDLNGDGLADIAMADPGIYNGGSGRYAPRVYVYLGSRECLTRHWQTWPMAASAVDSLRLGVSIGDFNGDGFGDLVTGSMEGGLRIFAGGPSGPDATPMDTTALAGIRSQFVGDINGDGYNDLIAQGPEGQYTNEEPLHVFYGNSRGRFDFFSRALWPSCPSGFRCLRYVGHTMRGADLDEDGFADVLVAAHARLYVLRGSRSGLVQIAHVLAPSGTECSDYRCAYAATISSPGDLDGDGHLEFAVGAPVSPRATETGAEGPGQVFLYRHTALSAMPTHFGLLSAVSPLQYAGYTSPLLDVDGDGYDDLLVGGVRRSARPPGFLSSQIVLSLYRGVVGFPGVVRPVETASPEFTNGELLE